MSAEAHPTPPQRSAPNEESRLDDYVGFHLRRASLRDMGNFARAFSKEGLKPATFAVVCLVGENPGVTAAEMCRLAGFQRANLAPILAELDERRLIERRLDAADQRVQRLHLTEFGTETLRAWRVRVEEREERLLERLSDRERRTLRGLLRKIWERERRT